MAIWTKLEDISGNFAMCGDYFGSKSYFGGYGSGNIYSFTPLSLELENSGESILSMCSHGGVLYAASENNDGAEWPDCKTGVYRIAGGGWVRADITGYAAFFMCSWGTQLIVTTSSSGRLNTLDIWSSTDGENFDQIGHIDNWAWVPFVFNGDLYLAGHRGAVQAAENNGSLVLKYNGSGFDEVPALCDICMEWQCAVEHKGFLFLGAGGWLLGRGTSQATIYRFDGHNCTAVKNDSGYHEVQNLLSATDGNLYASLGHGFKSDDGGSRVLVSADAGETWTESGSFNDCPQLYALMETSDGLMAGGGSDGNLKIYSLDFDGEPGPGPLPPEPTPPGPTPPSACNRNNIFGVFCPICYSADVSSLESGCFSVFLFKCAHCLAVFDRRGNLKG
jgi:hypothetical protein